MQAQTLLHHATDTLSRAATAIRAKSAELSHAEDMDSQMGDCDGLCGKTHASIRDTAMDRLAREHGYCHFDALWDALASRTTPRWMHFNIR